jgi:hypothetical protein
MLLPPHSLHLLRYRPCSHLTPACHFAAGAPACLFAAAVILFSSAAILLAAFLSSAAILLAAFLSSAAFTTTAAPRLSTPVSPPA